MGKIGKSVLKERAPKPRPPTKAELEAMARYVEEEQRRRRQRKQSPKVAFGSAPTAKEIAQEAVDRELGAGERKVEEIRQYAREHGVSFTTADEILRRQKKKQE